MKRIILFFYVVKMDLPVELWQIVVEYLRESHRFVSTDLHVWSVRSVNRRLNHVALREIWRTIKLCTSQKLTGRSYALPHRALKECHSLDDVVRKTLEWMYCLYYLPKTTMKSPPQRALYDALRETLKLYLKEDERWILNNLYIEQELRYVYSANSVIKTAKCRQVYETIDALLMENILDQRVASRITEILKTRLTGRDLPHFYHPRFNPAISEDFMSLEMLERYYALARTVCIHCSSPRDRLLEVLQTFDHEQLKEVYISGSTADLQVLAQIFSSAKVIKLGMCFPYAYPNASDLKNILAAFGSIESLEIAITNSSITLGSPFLNADVISGTRCGELLSNLDWFKNIKRLALGIVLESHSGGTHFVLPETIEELLIDTFFEYRRRMILVAEGVKTLVVKNCAHRAVEGLVVPNVTRLVYYAAFQFFELPINISILRYSIGAEIELLTANAFDKLESLECWATPYEFTFALSSILKPRSLILGGIDNRDNLDQFLTPEEGKYLPPKLTVTSAVAEFWANEPLIRGLLCHPDVEEFYMMRNYYRFLLEYPLTKWFDACEQCRYPENSYFGSWTMPYGSAFRLTKYFEKEPDLTICQVLDWWK